jgi:hypothetical protein
MTVDAPEMSSQDQVPVKHHPIRIFRKWVTERTTLGSILYNFRANRKNRTIFGAVLATQ